MKAARVGIILILLSITGAAAFYRPAASRAPASLSPSSNDKRSSYERPEKIPYPSYNPYTVEKYELGEKLFFDKRLSKSNLISCASCHNPALGWSDGLAKGVGHNGQILPRRVPTILNAAWGRDFFWDGRARTLEEQALGPIQAEKEMNTPLPELMKKVRGIPEYVEGFQKAFPDENLSPELVGKAIATFERGVVSDLAPFDYWVAGEENAISLEAKRGFKVFNEVGCVRCHTGWNFTNGTFADIGLPSEDTGKGKIVNSRDVDFAFKTPTLRNIAKRGPYMHDGSLRTLREVVENYDKGGQVQRRTTKFFLKPMALTEEQKSDLISFLETLTSEDEIPRGEWKGEQWVK